MAAFGGSDDKGKDTLSLKDSQGSLLFDLNTLTLFHPWKEEIFFVGGFLEFFDKAIFDKIQISPLELVPIPIVKSAL